MLGFNELAGIMPLLYIIYLVGQLLKGVLEWLISKFN